MKTSVDIQNNFDNGRYELLNGNFEESVSFFSEVLRLDQKHNRQRVLSMGQNKSIEATP